MGRIRHPTQQVAVNFTVQGAGDQGQPLYQAYSITVDPNQPLAIVLPSEGSALGPGMAGAAYAQNFFLSGGAAPYTWSMASGHHRAVEPHDGPVQQPSK